ncbi:MAG: agmatinase [Desulfobacterales bacterium]|nr:agmatinase [Desulfobacterales bacterium]MDD4073571.1 agmatinase [Desulfobacterales bacterium]MDD4393134.1 agmatinase [Desulfobacterales bacterium]
MTIPRFIPFGGDEVRPIDYDEADIVVLPLCYEHAPSYGTGSEQGPYYILEASEQLERIDEQTLAVWGDYPIYTLEPVIPPPDPEKAVIQMKTAAHEVLTRHKFLLSLGGDHAVSIGPIMAASQVYPDMGVLQIDAHLDLRNEWNGSRYNHACVMRRVLDDVKVPIVQVGIRSFSPEEADLVKKRHLSPFYAHTITPSDRTWIDRVIEALPETIYMTIDLDGLDPSVIPGTGTPEPGGLSYRQLLDLIDAVGKHKTVIAADINELAKIPGTQVSEYTAAKIATKIMVYCRK